MKIQLITNNPEAWIIPYGERLQKELIAKGHECRYVNEERDVEPGDILVFLCYEKVFKNLHLNKHNLVIHESALPHGRGMSPLTWQILEGKNRIPITLLEASTKIDEGIIYDQTWIEFEGHELLPELKQKQGEATISLVHSFVDSYPNIVGKEQVGEPSYYNWRKPTDSELNVRKTIAEQFNLLRVVDNERYPAFFIVDGQKYIIKINKA